MKIIDLIIFFLANYGLAYIVTQSVLFKEPRDFMSAWLYKKATVNFKEKQTIIQKIYLKLDYLITCIICASVWTSVLLCFALEHSSIIQISTSITDLPIYILIAPVATMLINSQMLEEEEYD